MKKNIVYTAAVYSVAAFIYPFRRVCVFINKVMHNYRLKCFERDKLKAINKANELHKATGYRYLVLTSGGKFIIKPKAQIKNMLKIKGKFFKPDTTMRDIERIAIYITK